MMTDSTTLILKTLANLKRAKFIIADVTTAMANADFREQGRLEPLQTIKNKVEDYVQTLLVLKGEKKIFAEQIQEKNKKYDELLESLEKKSKKLEETYDNFKKIKTEFESKYQETNKNDPAISGILASLQTLSITYEKEVRQFIQKEVNQLKNNLELLKTEAKSHTPLEHQRKIEGPILSDREKVQLG